MRGMRVARGLGVAMLGALLLGECFSRPKGVVSNVTRQEHP
ncbi:MAG TPA: hypothetical protein VMH00_01020 [Candidatus Limnocylindrales bacterium]|nr:hypothetical protein [Candidatus Limnocylindrales bacterium]